MMEVTGTVVRVIRPQAVAFDWKIKDVSQILGGGRYLGKSPKFHFCSHTLYLKLYTFSNYDEVELLLMTDDPHSPAGIACSLAIRSASGKTEMEVVGTRSSWTENCMAIKIMMKSELLSRRKELLPFDVLTVTATLMINNPAAGTTDVCVQTRVEDIAAEDGEDEKYEKTGTERVLQDIGKMWPSDEHCDVVFRVGDVEFEAHRAILSARTPGLGAMFRHDTVEKASGVVTIEDCEPAVFEQLLHYVYKGAPREVKPENAYLLYTVADKYLVSEVKTLCVRYLRDTLCVDTFCNTLTLALIHKEDELLETAVDFFSRNMIGILKTVQWQTFLRDHLMWANEIMIRSEEIREGRKPGGDWPQP